MPSPTTGGIQDSGYYPQNAGTPHHGLSAGAMLAAPAILSRPADAAEFNYKFATNQPLAPSVQHPCAGSHRPHPRAIQRPHRHAAVSEQPARWRHRHAEPVARRRHPFLPDLRPYRPDHRARGRRQRLGFAFKDYDTVWAAMDGDFGEYLRAQMSGQPASTCFRRSGTTASAR